MLPLNANRSPSSFGRGRWPKMKGKLDKYFYPSHRIESIVNKTREGGFHVCGASIVRIERMVKAKGKLIPPFLTIFKMTVVYTPGGRQATSVCLSLRNENVGLQRADGTLGT